MATKKHTNQDKSSALIDLIHTKLSQAKAIADLVSSASDPVVTAQLLLGADTLTQAMMAVQDMIEEAEAAFEVYRTIESKKTLHAVGSGQ